ncbi:MAG: membrane protein insertion efficiency factor YidD [Clostridia bacterium]|nr:membrane protein insertion efficiency factor YidD [Clostridia bacterium]
MTAAIRFYRRHISRLLGPMCRYYPTCSQYAITAVERYGAFRGGVMAVFRLLRCNPLFKGGYDPVPEKSHRLK